MRSWCLGWILAAVLLSGCTLELSVPSVGSGPESATSFSLSVGRAAGPATRMSDATVQSSGIASFRGLEQVYVALEIVNNTGKDIWGELNLIRNGGTFYLVGELNPSTATIPASMKTNGAVDLTRSNFYYPPFAADGKTQNIVRVFMQDYVTNVCFTFGPNSLKHAYVTMPDLRASQVSLGLSVDLKWEDGLIFEDVPLGGN